MARTTELDIISWGSNQYGELGRADGSYLPKRVAIAKGDDDAPSQISANGFSSGYCGKSGRLFLWGFFKGPGLMVHQGGEREREREVDKGAALIDTCSCPASFGLASPVCVLVWAGPDARVLPVR